MFSTLRLACFLCLGFAISVVFGHSPIAHALAAKSSASVFTPPMETPCIADWQGPSSHNTFSCDGEDLTEWVMKNNLWSYGIPFALALLICIPGCCCVLCCRYLCGCCGGGTRQRPGHICCGGSDLDNLSEAEKAQMYSLGCIYATKIFAIAVGMVAVAGLILNIVGGVRISMGMSEVAEAFEELVNWFLQVIGEARDGIKDSNGNYPDGFDFSMFEDAENTVRDYKQTYFSDGIETAKTPLLIGSLVPAFISVLPAILLLLPGIAALCNSRRCMPTVVVVLSFPIQLIYFFVVTLLLIVLVPVDLICNELESKPGEKSVMQWYVIPSCDAESPFQSVIDNVNEMEVDAATEGCQKLLDFCSTTMVWSVSDPERVFYCNLTNAATECRSLEDIVSKVDGMVVKTGAPETCSGNASGCTLRQCAVSCDNNDAKESAKEAVDALATAQRVMHVFETVLLPWLDCSRLVDKLLGLGPRQMCSTMRDGLTFFKDGSILIAAGCVIGMIVSLFGEKRFINPDKLLEDELARAEIFNKQVAEQQHHNPIMIIGAPTQVIDVMPPQYANAYPETTDPNYVIKAVPLVDNVDETSPQQITCATVEQPVYAPEEEAVERDVGATEMKTYETVEPTPEVVAESPQHDQKQEQVPYAYTYEGAYSAPPADRDVQEVAETTAETTEMKVYETAKPTSVEAPQTHNEEPYVPTSGETDASYDPNVPQVHTSEGPYSPTSDNENVEQV